MSINLYMLGALIKDGILGNVKSNLNITK